MINFSGARGCQVLFRSIAIAFLLVIFSAHAGSGQAVTFTGNAKAFSIVATATGTVSTSGPFLDVELNSGTIRSTSLAKQPIHITGFRVGLVHRLSSGAWEVERWSARVPRDVRLGHLETIDVAPQTLKIPVDGLGSLGGKWLVIAIDVMNPSGRGYTYSHSRKLDL